MGDTDLWSKPGIVFDLTTTDPKERIQAFIDTYKQDEVVYDTALFRSYLKLLSATTATPHKPATAIFTLYIDPSLCSRAGRCHGGAVALVFDMTTSATQAIVATETFWPFSGFSRNLNVTYFRPVKKGSTVIVECEIVQVGKALATIHAKMKRRDGVMLCFAEHHKAYVDLKKPRL